MRTEESSIFCFFGTCISYFVFIFTLSSVLNFMNQTSMIFVDHLSFLFMISYDLFKIINSKFEKPTQRILTNVNFRSLFILVLSYYSFLGFRIFCLIYLLKSLRETWSFIKKNCSIIKGKTFSCDFISQILESDLIDKVIIAIQYILLIYLSFLSTFNGVAFLLLIFYIIFYISYFYIIDENHRMLWKKINFIVTDFGMQRNDIFGKSALFIVKKFHEFFDFILLFYPYDFLKENLLIF